MDSSQTLLRSDSRPEIEFVPVVQEDDDDLEDEPDIEPSRQNSLTPLELGGNKKNHFKVRKRNRLLGLYINDVYRW